MNLPKIIEDLVKAQDNFDAIAYAHCFSEKAIVFDEGKTYNGRKEIEQWISSSNEQYRTVMKPVSMKIGEKESVLKAEISGTFPGSPIVLDYHVKIVDDKIQSLRISI